MKKLIILTLIVSAVSLAYSLVTPFSEVRAFVANPNFISSTLLQTEPPRPIRALPDLEEIWVWVGRTTTPEPYSFGPNDGKLTARLNVLDDFSFDMRPVAIPGPPGASVSDSYDIFYSNADGTLNVDGAYLTIEAVSYSQGQGAGGGNVAEVGLRFSGASTFEYGNTVASFVALGNNADPALNSNAIDGNTQTFTSLGNTVGQSQRLRITVGFRSSSGGVTPCTYSITPATQSFPSDGGTGTFRLETPDGCPWFIAPPIFPPLSINMTSRLQGSGNATVSYSVRSNAYSPSSRVSGTILILPARNSPPVQGFTVTQEPVDCSASTYSVSPPNLVFEWDQDALQKIYVNAPRGCDWSATSNADWITVINASSTVEIKAQMNTGPWRGGSVTVAGKVIGVFQNSPHCGFETFCRAFPAVCGVKASNILALSRSFRDHTLAQTQRGKAYTETYYRFSPEAVQIMMLNPILMLRSREVIERYKPVLESMVNGEPVTLTRGDLDEIDGFLNSFAAKGSPDFRQAIQRVCNDLHDPKAHEEFGISVTEGPKREMPAQLFQSRNGEGGWLFMGSLMAFAYCFIGTRRFDRKGRRLLCVMLTMLLGVGQWSVASGHSRFTASPGGLATQAANDRRAPLRLSGPRRKPALAFEANQGQADSQVRFISRGDRYSMLLTPTEAAFRLRTTDCGMRPEDGALAQQSEKSRFKMNGSPSGLVAPISPQSATCSSQSAILRMKLVGANPLARMTGLDQLQGKANYFIGKDSTRWRAQVPTYARVQCEHVYPGVDLIYYGNRRELEYDFNVAPGADPKAIKLKFDGADRVEIDGHGDLVLSIADRQVRQHKPIAYQETGGGRKIIPARYVIDETQGNERNSTLSPQPSTFNAGKAVGFELGAYDKALPLIIDPVLAYSTYLGGSGDDESNSIAVDSSGNLYVVGFTDSINFPMPGATQPIPGGGQQEAFVAKLNATGTQLIYSTYLGGDGQDNGSSIAVDSAGNAYITGFTGSDNFPTRNAMQPAKNGPFNAFVAKLDAAGSLLYSTHLGGNLGDYGSSITVDASGNVYVAGVATSSNFPTVSAIQSAQGGAADVYVAKLNPAGSQLLYSTYLGGAGDDGATSIAVDSVGNAYLTGVTSSPNFRTMNPLQTSHGGGLFDAFVAKVNPSGSQLTYATYLGGSGEDRGLRIAVDSAGNAYVTGDTDSANFPTASPLQQSIGGSSDAFVAKLNATGTQLVYSTFLGGSGIDGGTAIAVAPSGNAYITGFTASANFPTASPLQQSYGGGSFDGFIAKLNLSGAAFDYATYLGGSGIDAGFGVAVDSSGNAYVMGLTDSTNFPTAAPFQQSFGGGASDVFLAKLKTGPEIARAMVSGKKLLVFGTDFDSGARILLNGEPQKTRNDEQNPSTTLIAKKSGKQIAPGQTVTLQVRNADGTLSNQFNFSR